MARNNKTNVVLGSGKLYMVDEAETFQSYDQIAVEGNLLGYIKGGAELAYTEETYEEKDDLGYVSKIITTNETATLKAGILTWNADTLQKLINRCKVESISGGKKVTIGGKDAEQNKVYAIAFEYEDEYGKCYVVIRGRNTAGVTLTFAKDSGTVINPEFTAMPQGDDGTLIQFIELDNA